MSRKVSSHNQSRATRSLSIQPSCVCPADLSAPLPSPVLPRHLPAPVLLHDGRIALALSPLPRILVTTLLLLLLLLLGQLLFLLLIFLLLLLTLAPLDLLLILLLLLFTLLVLFLLLILLPLRILLSVPAHCPSCISSRSLLLSLRPAPAPSPPAAPSPSWSSLAALTPGSLPLSLQPQLWYWRGPGLGFITRHYTELNCTELHGTGLN